MVGLRMPSNRTLGNICVYGAVVSISAVMYMRWKMEDRVRSCEYYKLALKGLRQHRGAVALLGEPIKDLGIDLGNANNNCNAEKAQFEVSVRGSKDKGKVIPRRSYHQILKGFFCRNAILLGLPPTGTGLAHRSIGTGNQAESRKAFPAQKIGRAELNRDHKSNSRPQRIIDHASEEYFFKQRNP